MSDMILEMPDLEDLPEEALLDSANYDLEITAVNENVVTVTNKETGEQEER